MFQNEASQSHAPTYADYAAAGLAAPIIPTFMKVHDPNEERNRLRAEVERMLSQSDQNEDDDDIALPEMAPGDVENEENELDDDMAYTMGTVEDAYFPYPNKVV
ncbi:hypothetical protein B0H10DRAFT_1969373 [Mycena sp. CBHHK59/15]|nr:hypothetical protein B0H10DRAFT_1969373 [Mycena sp. CBHHK59/15]